MRKLIFLLLIIFSLVIAVSCTSPEDKERDEDMDDESSVVTYFM